MSETPQKVDFFLVWCREFNAHLEACDHCRKKQSNLCPDALAIIRRMPQE